MKEGYLGSLKNFDVRFGRIEDAAGIIEVIRSVDLGRGHPNGWLPRERPDSHYIDMLNNEDFASIVATVDGRIIGNVFLCFGGFAVPNQAKFTAMLVSWFAVRPDFQGMRVGRRLYGAVRQYMHALSLDNMAIAAYVDAQNVKSQRFHQNNGFELQGEMEFEEWKGEPQQLWAYFPEPMF